jgi:prepilin peptidase CpaA
MVAFGVVAIALLVYAALHDVAARTVPNWLPVCVAVLGCAARIADHTIEPALIIAAITFAALFVIWVLGIMGGGDVKLWAATVLLIPPHLQLELNFYMGVFLLGGLLGGVYLALWPLMRRRNGHAVAPKPIMRKNLLGRAMRAEAWRIGRRGPLPYACAISASAIFALLPPTLQI